MADHDDLVHFRRLRRRDQLASEVSQPRLPVQTTAAGEFVGRDDVVKEVEHVSARFGQPHRGDEGGEASRQPRWCRQRGRAAQRHHQRRQRAAGQCCAEQQGEEGHIRIGEKRGEAPMRRGQAGVGAVGEKARQHRESAGDLGPGTARRIGPHHVVPAQQFVGGQHLPARPLGGNGPARGGGLGLA